MLTPPNVARGSTNTPLAGGTDMGFDKDDHARISFSGLEKDSVMGWF
jgi:hypothetical protein